MQNSITDPVSSSKTGKLYMVITVDTESSDSPRAVSRKDLLDSMIYGKVRHRYWGVPKILDILDEYECKVTFFISVFEYKKYGESALQDVCALIREKGHDIQLHVHPVWAYGRRFMTEYTFEEQAEIIKKGAGVLERWSGERPVAYRGGAYYSLNKDTFKALKANGIAVDSTMFYGQPHCGYVATRNRVIDINGIMELPITICRVRFEVSMGLFNYRSRPRYSKTDINEECMDLYRFVEAAKENDLRVMTLFLHSYSFLDFDSSYENPRPNYEDMEKFKRLLAMVSKDPGIEIVTVKQLYGLFLTHPELFTTASDYVPQIGVKMGLVPAVRSKLTRFNLLSRLAGV